MHDNLAIVFFLHHRVVQYIFGTRSLEGINFEHTVHHMSELSRENHRDPLENTRTHLLVQSLQVMRREWRLKGRHLVDHAS